MEVFPAFRLILAATLLFSLSACQSLEKGHPQQKTRVSHVVIVWLKHPGDEAARAALITASKSFREIPGVTSVEAGTVLPSKRAGVDSSFDVAVVIGFGSKKALADYASHPVHQQAVKETLQPLASRFVAYDFVNR